MTPFVDTDKPDHVAIIMDGNGRWATGRGLKRVFGHRKGAEAVRSAVEAARDSDIKFLTLFAFSSENWKRPKDEVSYIMDLISLFIHRELKTYHAQNIRFQMIGDRNGLSSKVLESLGRAEALTCENTGLHVIVALNYGSRAEIVRAAAALAREAAEGKISPDDIDEAMISGRLDTAGIPDPDLIIRTSGEQRLSNFLMWQSAYSELVFLPCLWPEFSRDMFVDALQEYARRTRRFGSVVEASSAMTGF